MLAKQLQQLLRSHTGVQQHRHENLLRYGKQPNCLQGLKYQDLGHLLSQFY